MKILLLEDETILRRTIMEFLEEIGNVVCPFADGLSAKTALLNESFDLLILDINVPKINGFELLEAARDLGIATPVIYISALVDIEEITKGFTLGCSDYLKKPFHLRELALRIDNVARLKALSRQNHIPIGKNYSYNSAQKTLYFRETPQEITKKQQQIIELLTANLGLVVDFEMFREFAWDSDPIDNASIRAEINRLKKIFDEEVIKNIRGLGYKIERVCKV
jgi:DNA-binding response OmpR family regulator